MSDVTPNTPESETPEAAPPAAEPRPLPDTAEYAAAPPQPEPEAPTEESVAAPEEPEAVAAETPADDAPAESEAPAVEAAPPAPESKKKWYVVKVQSNREESIKAAIERKVKIEGLEEYFGQIAIPVEQVTQVKKVSEKKNGEKVTKEKRVVKDQKKFPGYIFAEVEFNDRILYLFRETGGVGDFVGATRPDKPPAPMTEREVQAMLNNLPDPDGGKKGPKGKIKVKIEVEKGDKVRIREGAFSGMEGEVKTVTEPKDADETPKITVEVSIFGRPVPVELDYWQVDKV